MLAALVLQLATDTLVADISQAPSPGAENGLPRLIASDGQHAWFTARTEPLDSDSYLCRSDGSEAGTGRVASFPMSVTFVDTGTILPDGKLVFGGNSSGTAGLWASDGTEAGTNLLFDESVSETVAFAGSAWFEAEKPGTIGGSVLWKSDGTVQGTAPAFELTPASDLEVLDLFAEGGKLYFNSLVPGGEGLWASDGTAGGSTFLKAFPPFGNDFEHHASAGGRALFSIGSFGPDRGVWGTDGTPAGTVRLIPDVTTQWMVTVGDEVYVAAQGLLWRSDGTVAGTQPVQVENAFGSQQQGVSAEPGIAFGDRLVYGGRFPLAPCNTLELAITDGTVAGTAQVLDLYPGCSGSDPEDFGTFGGLVLFTAEHPDFGRELWVTDGTEAGTQLLADTAPGPSTPPYSQAFDSFPFRETSNGALFSFDDGLTGRELWSTDGTTAGLLINFQDDPQSIGSYPERFARFGDRLLFYADDGVTGDEPYVSDGTSAGTVALGDLYPGPTGSRVSETRFLTLGDRAYFLARSDANEFELWRTDGTPVGTERFLQGVAGTDSSLQAAVLALFDNRLWFTRGWGATPSLWSTDGTQAGTTQHLSLSPGQGFTGGLDTTDERLFFLIREASSTVGALWSTDGSPGGEALFLGTPPTAGATGFWCTESRVWWFGTDGTETGVRSSPDTAATPELVLGQDPQTLFYEFMTTFGDQSVFRLTLAGPTIFGEVVPDGQALVVSDGTSAGTQVVYGNTPGPSPVTSSPVVASGERLYFLDYGETSNDPTQLIASDGTPGGSTVLLSVPEGSNQSLTPGLMPIGSGPTLLFEFDDGNGREAWRTDGTLAGTYALTDIAPGTDNAQFGQPLQIGERLYFRADDGVVGVELHAMAASLANSPDVTELGAGCAGSTGAPRLTLTDGAPILGTSLTLELSEAFPASLSLWFSGSQLGPLVPVDTCFIAPSPLVYEFALPTDASGRASFTTTLGVQPDLVGLSLVLQTLSVEVGGPLLGIGTTSNALELVFGS